MVSPLQEIRKPFNILLLIENLGFAFFINLIFSSSINKTCFLHIRTNHIRTIKLSLGQNFTKKIQKNLSYVTLSCNFEDSVDMGETFA